MCYVYSECKRIGEVEPPRKAEPQVYMTWQVCNPSEVHALRRSPNDHFDNHENVQGPSTHPRDLKKGSIWSYIRTSFNF